MIDTACASASNRRLGPSDRSADETSKTEILLSAADLRCGSVPCDRRRRADSFTLSASAQDFGSYFPSYLANGYFSTMTAPRGTEGNLAYMVAFMDYAKDDMSRPAAIPGWSEIDYSTGDSAGGPLLDESGPGEPRAVSDYQPDAEHERGDADDELSLRRSQAQHPGQRSRPSSARLRPHLAATQISLTPDFDGTVQLSFALNLWAPHQPRLPLAKLTGDEMQEAVAATQYEAGRDSACDSRPRAPFGITAIRTC